MTEGPRPPRPTYPPGDDADPGTAGRGRPAALVRLLARHPEQVVSVARLVEALWPGIDLATGRARLHVVASRVRRKLPPGMRLETVDDGYRLVGSTPTRAGAAGARSAERGGSPGDATPMLHPAILREAVLDRLPAAGGVPLIAVSAPTGFGKTVVLRQWAARQTGRVTWVDLAAEPDPAAACDQALGIVVAAEHGSPGRGPAAVVLEGFERVSSPDLVSQLTAVVRRRSPITLVLSSREALPLPLGRMVVRGEAVVLGPDELALTSAEAELLRAGAGAGLVRLTGGWAEGVSRLGAVPDPDTAVAARAGAPLRQRILGGLPPDLADLLQAVAVLDHIHPALADAVTETKGSGPGLAVLADRHHLLVRQGGGYVHRPLIRLLLGREVTADIRLAHRRAGRWHLRHGDPQHALHHAAAASDGPTVRAAFAPAVRVTAEQGDAATLLDWTTSLRPPSHPEGAAVALVVWALAPEPGRTRWRPGDDAPPAVQVAARAVEDMATGRCAAALSGVIDARARLVDLDAEARPAVDSLLHLVEAEARTFLGHVVPWRGDVVGPQPWPWFVLWTFGLRALASELAGRRQEAAALIDHGRARAGSLHGSWRALAPGPWALAGALVELDRSGGPADRARAVADLELLVERLDPVHQPLAVIARHGLHLACRRVGDEHDAARWLAEADARSRSLPDLSLLPAARDALVRRAGQTPFGGLTAQERQVLGYLSTDMALGEIADALFLSPHTVKAHTRAIYRKLQVHSRTEAVDAILRL